MELADQALLWLLITTRAFTIPWPSIRVQWTRPTFLGQDFPVRVPTGVDLDINRRRIYVPIPWRAIRDEARRIANNAKQAIRRGLPDVSQSWIKLRRFIGSRVTSLVKPWARRINNIGQFVNRQIDRRVPDVALSWRGLRQFIGSRVKSLVQGWARDIRNIGRFVRRQINQTVKRWARRIDDIGQFVRGVIRRTLPDVVQAWRRLRRFIGNRIRALVKDWARRINNIGRFVSRQVHRLLPSWIFNIGSIEGFIHGILVDVFPKKFLDDPVTWTFNAVLDEAERRIGDPLLLRIRRLVDEALEHALSEETKQKIRDQDRRR